MLITNQSNFNNLNNNIKIPFYSGQIQLNNQNINNSLNNKISSLFTNNNYKPNFECEIANPLTRILSFSSSNPKIDPNYKVKCITVLKENSNCSKQQLRIKHYLNKNKNLFSQSKQDLKTKSDIKVNKNQGFFNFKIDQSKNQVLQGKSQTSAVKNISENIFKIAPQPKKGNLSNIKFFQSPVIFNWHKPSQSQLKVENKTKTQEKVNFFNETNIFSSSIQKQLNSPIFQVKATKSDFLQRDRSLNQGESKSIEVKQHKNYFSFLNIQKNQQSINQKTKNIIDVKSIVQKQNQKQVQIQRIAQLAQIRQQNHENISKNQSSSQKQRSVRQSFCSSKKQDIQSVNLCKNKQIDTFSEKDKIQNDKQLQQSLSSSQNINNQEDNNQIEQNIKLKQIQKNQIKNSPQKQKYLYKQIGIAIDKNQQNFKNNFSIVTQNLFQMKMKGLFFGQSYSRVFSCNPLPKKGNNYFQIKCHIKSGLKQNKIKFGIAKQQKNPLLYNYKSSILYDMSQRVFPICYKGNYRQRQNQIFDSNTFNKGTLSVYLDMSKKYISFYINDKFIQWTQFEQQFVSQNIYAFLEVQNSESVFQFVELQKQ